MNQKLEAPIYRTVKLLILTLSLTLLMLLVVIFVDPWLRFGLIPAHWIPEWAGVFVLGMACRSMYRKIPAKRGATIGFVGVTIFAWLAYVRDLSLLDSVILATLLLSFSTLFAAGYLYEASKSKR